MTSLPSTPFFYIGMYLLIGVLLTVWNRRGLVGQVHAKARKRFGNRANTMMIAPVILWPVSVLFSLFRIIGILPTAWKIKVKDRTCKCGGEYRTQRVLVDNADIFGKLMVKCWACGEISELSGSVEIDDPEANKK